MHLHTQPYPSRRSPVLADRGVVATSQPLAAQAGLWALQQGGNAVDAAIATAMVLTVVEPTSNGIGADAFAIVWDGQRLHGLNGSGRWPRAMSAEALREQGCDAVPERGWRAVTVPGAPATWEALSERFGRLPLARLLEPAIRYAEAGFPVSPVIARLWGRGAELFLALEDPAVAGWRETFSRNGTPPAPGERWTSPGHASCLRALAEHGVRDFYEGSIARRIADFAAETGGALTLDDLAAHHSEWVEPISVRYRGVDVWEIPPNGQGIAALIALGILEGTDFAGLPQGDPAAWHLQLEAMKLAFADAYRYVADPAHAPVPVSGLLDPAYLAERRGLVGERARTPEPGRPPGGGTVYLCTADADGMMVSFIQSNFMGFGSGVVVPGLGIALQNRAASFTLEPGHPNEAAGGKRPRQTIIPGFLTRGGEAIGPFGVMGGEMQPQGHMQVVAHLVDHGANPQTALDAPRWQLGDALEVKLEPGADAATVDALRARGHRVEVQPDSLSFGRGQIIWRRDDGVYVAGSEPRTDGMAVGY